MAQPAPGPEDPTLWGEVPALELWKYFGGVGAADKNAMVTVESLLLGFSSLVLSYLVTTVIRFDPFCVTKPYQGFSLALLGLVISLLAAYVALLYGGYSNWNWAMADKIARQREGQKKWAALLPENADTSSPRPGASWFFNKAMKWGRPCEPTKRLAPIFCLYATLALLAALTHAGVVVVSARVLLS
jgi:hypothetical protein